MSLSGKKIEKLIDLGYKNSKEKKDTKRFKIDKKYTNDKHTVVDDTKTGRKTVIFKGTNPTDTRDLVSDFRILTGRESSDPRFKNSKKIVEKIRKASQREGKGSKLNIVGHSLGGSLAEKSANSKKDTVITVNKGAGVGSINRKVGSNQTDIRSKFDIVSALSNFNKGKRTTLSSNNKNIRQLGKKGAHSFKGLNLKKSIKFD